MEHRALLHFRELRHGVESLDVCEELLDLQHNPRVLVPRHFQLHAAVDALLLALQNLTMPLAVALCERVQLLLQRGDVGVLQQCDICAQLLLL